MPVVTSLRLSVAGVLRLTSGLNLRVVHEGFFLYKEGLQQVFSDAFGFSLAVIISPIFHIHVLSRLFCFVGMVLDTHCSEPHDLIYSSPTSFLGDFWFIYQHRHWPTDLRFCVVYEVSVGIGGSSTSVQSITH